jgi:hypothetical protein
VDLLSRVATARRWRGRLAALLLCACLPPAGAAEVYQADAVKAAFLYRFAGYVDWPAPPAGGRFVVAVLDADAVADELQRLLPAHPPQGLPAQVLRVHAPQEAAAAQMLYVGPDWSGDPRSLAALAARPILVVTDRDGGLDLGGSINFLLVDRRLRFEVSLLAAEKAGLKIAPPLLAVAANVRGAPHSDACLPGAPPLPPCLAPGGRS